MNDQEILGKITLTFIDVINQLRIYHWQTKSYARHKASCELLSKLNDLSDKIIETLQGARNVRIYIPDDFNNITLNNQNDKNIIGLLEYFKVWLSETLPQYLLPEESDVLNIRDEILGEVNKTIYLFTFN